MPRIFISYRRGDSQAITGRIRDRLANAYGEKSIFMDIDSIPDGTVFVDEIEGALRESGVLLAIIGPNWLGQPSRIGAESDPVRMEIETALTRGISVIPVLVDGAQMPQAADLPGSLQKMLSHNAATVDAGRDFHHHMERLTSSIEKMVKRKWWIEIARGGSKYVIYIGAFLVVLRLAYVESMSILNSNEQIRIDEFFSCGSRVLYPAIAFYQETRTFAGQNVHVLLHARKEALVRLYSSDVQHGDSIGGMIDKLSRGTMVSYRRVLADEFGLLSGWRASSNIRNVQEEYYFRLQLTSNKGHFILYEMAHPPKDQASHPYWNVNEIVSRTLLPKGTLSEVPAACDFRPMLIRQD